METQQEIEFKKEAQGQKENVLRHLKRYGSITPLNALELFGCFRLAAVILRLRKEGHKIDTNMIKIEESEKHFAKYVPMGCAGTL